MVLCYSNYAISKAAIPQRNILILLLLQNNSILNLVLFISMALITLVALFLTFILLADQRCQLRTLYLIKEKICLLF